MQAKAAKKVLVVMDPTRESAGALQYALSHSLLDNDELILLHVENPSNWIHGLNFQTFLKIPPNLASAAVHGNASNLGIDPVRDFLEEKRNECLKQKSNVKVRIERVPNENNGRDKADTILHNSEVLGVDILVIGQRPSLFPKGNLGAYTWHGGRSGGSSKGIHTAEYLIENSKCTCVGVQKKGQAGGYVINSKTHKNFWLLA